MIHFIFTPMDRRYLFLKADTELEHSIIKNKLMEVINLTDPICYLPTYTGIPFKQEFLWQYRQSSGDIVYYAPIGMWYPIWKWFKENNIEFDGLDASMFKNTLPHTFEQFKEIVDSWGMSRTPRPYQYESAYKVLQYKEKYTMEHGSEPSV